MSDYEEEQREEVDALLSIFSEEMMVKPSKVCNSNLHLLDGLCAGYYGEAPYLYNIDKN